MRKSLVPIMSISMIAFTATSVLAASSDPVTSLPLYPALLFATKQSADVCGTPVSSSTYSPGDAKLVAIEGWFASHLKGFKLIHGTARSYPLDAFVNSDTTLSVSIGGSRSVKNGVDVVIYHRNPKPASADKKIDLINWFDGGDPICR